jgi:hypothetical protein
MEPESDEVTKKKMTTTIARIDVTKLSGKLSRKTNRETGMFS